MASLQDQLLKAGMVDDKKAKKIRQEQRKKAKAQPKGQASVNETREQAKQALAEKSAHDKEVNRKRQAELDRKAISAQVAQLVTLNKIARGAGDTPYQFSDGKKIKKIFVTTLLQNQLSKGQLAVARSGESYELVPAVIANKILEREPQSIVLLNEPTTAEVDEEDPYADYEIPDDLMW